MVVANRVRDSSVNPAVPTDRDEELQRMARPAGSRPNLIIGSKKRDHLYWIVYSKTVLMRSTTCCGLMLYIAFS